MMFGNQPILTAPSPPASQAPRRAEALAPRTPVSLAASDLALAAAVGVLAIGFLLPQVSAILQIILISAFIIQGSASWLPAIVALLLTPTDFKSGGMELQYEKFEGVTVYVLGFPMTASYAIVGAVLVRGLFEWATMSGYLQRGLNRLWIIPAAIASSICVYAGILALGQGVRGWSAAARATLLLVSLWYALSLTRDWALLREVMMRRMGPLCAAIVASGFFAPVIGTFTCFYMPFAIAWATLVGFGSARREYPALRPIALASLLICLLVPIGGIRVSAAVATASYAKQGNSWLPTNSLAMAISALALSLLHGRMRIWAAGRTGWLIATLAFTAYVALPFVVASFSVGKEFDTSGNVGTLTQRITYKLFVERPAIWRGVIEHLTEPPYIVVTSKDDRSLITASGRRQRFQYSAHNLVLETLRSQGWASGLVSLLFLYICFVACVRVYITIADPAACVAATTFMAGGLVNGIGVGHMLESGPGFMFHVCAGIALGAVARMTLLSAIGQRSPSITNPPTATASPWTRSVATETVAYS